MKTAKELMTGFYRGDELGQRAATCKRLATGMTAAGAGMGLTDRELETLDKAGTLLREISAVYGKAAKLRKAAEAARAEWVKAARGAMKGTFDTLTTTADKVALVAFTKSHMLDIRAERGAWDAKYLLKDTFADCLNDLPYGLSPRLEVFAAGTPDQKPAAAVAAEWQRFRDRREQLQDKFAQVIVLVDRLLAQEVTP